ncbi:MAG: hypothetical protein EOO01_40610 [Chitinophagaceae bacterium]|nr:MAG: hypothetical protein EOO01_40610 [Chitinophagaceae bacterium]
MTAEKKGINKGGKSLAFALPMFFVGPSVVYNAFQNEHTYVHYIVLAVGILICAGAIILTFKGIRAVVNAQFDSDAERNSRN